MPRRVKFVELPVIKPPSLPLGIPLPSDLEKLPPELLIMIMLSLDVVAILSLCSTSSIIRRICQKEWFWKQKSIQDLGLPDNFEIGTNETWKNFYLNKINPIRELKQFIRYGNIESFRTLIQELYNEELETIKSEQEEQDKYDPLRSQIFTFGEWKGLPEDADISPESPLEPEPVAKDTIPLVRNIHNLMDLALKKEKIPFVHIILPLMVEIEDSVVVPPSKGLKILCLMAQTPKANKLFRNYLTHYITLYEHNYTRFRDPWGDWRVLDTGSRVPWDDIMKCVIQSGKKQLVGFVYTKFLNRFGISREKSRVDRYVDYAKSLRKGALARHIEIIYNSYLQPALLTMARNRSSIRI